MLSLDSTSAQCFIHTFKEGLLSKVAHDLKLRVDKFSIEVGEDGNLVASFDPNSIRVVCARSNGTDDHTALSSSDRSKIEASMRSDVLECQRFGTIRFEAQPAPDTLAFDGRLTLHGRSETVSVQLRRDGQDTVARVAFLQTRFAITPFKAMLGALKVQDQVEVEVRVRTASLVK